MTTLAADAIGFTTATAHGLVNPNGLATTWYFQYGTSPTYGSTTPLTSMPALVPGAIQLNGMNQFGIAGNLNLSDRSFSVEFWARSDGSNRWDMVVGQGTNSSHRGLHIGFRNNNRFTFGFWSDDLDAPLALSDNEWHHWACTYNVTNNERFIYRDGVAVATNTSASPYRTSDVLYIGHMGALGSYFGGAVDEVRVWSGVRTPTQINAGLHTSPANSAPGLLGLWHLDDGSGSSAAESSGQNIAATLINNPMWVEGIPQATPVEAALTGLAPNTLYYCRLVASNSVGEVFGSDVTFTTLAAPAAQLSGFTAFPDGSVRFGFTTVPSAPFTILATTNIALPLSQWPPLGAPVELSPGSYQFTDTQAMGHPHRFYCVRSP